MKRRVEFAFQTEAPISLLEKALVFFRASLMATAHAVPDHLRIICICVSPLLAG